MRREALRRNLAISAALGVGGGIAGVLLVHGDAGSDIVALVRLAMMLPAVVFVAWWMTGPGIIIDRSSDAAASEPVTDADALAARMQRVEHVFDDVAVPAAKRVAHDDEREWFRASIRRDSSIVSTETWGLPRRASDAPVPPRAADQV